MDVFAGTATVVMGNVPDKNPAATVTELGTRALEELLVKLTTLPPTGAGVERVNVPLAVPPPTMLDGVVLIAVMDAPRMERLAEAPPPAPDAAITADESPTTEDVVTVTLAEFDPAGITTIFGTLVIAVLLVESETANPPCGAIPFKLTVAVDTLPPRTAPGDRNRSPITAGSIVRVTVLAAEPSLAVTTAVDF